MNVIVSAAVFCFVVVLTAGQTYDTKYDNIDIDNILKNGRVLSNYVKCLMDQGPCTAEGRELKKTLPDALAGACSNCSAKQKSVAEKVSNHLMQHRPKDWDRLIKKYDPQGMFRKRHEEHLKTTKKA